MITIINTYSHTLRSIWSSQTSLEDFITRAPTTVDYLVLSDAPDAGMLMYMARWKPPPSQQLPTTTHTRRYSTHGCSYVVCTAFWGCTLSGCTCSVHHASQPCALWCYPVGCPCTLARCHPTQLDIRSTVLPCHQTRYGTGCRILVCIPAPASKPPSVHTTHICTKTWYPLCLHVHPTSSHPTSSHPLYLPTPGLFPLEILPPQMGGRCRPLV